MAHLYAEYLPNIKTLAITAVLKTPRDDTTALWLSNDRQKVILEHADETHRITLPAKVTGQGTQHLQLPNTGELHCVNRISAAPMFDDAEPPALWSATLLDSETNLHCKRCDALLSSNKIKIWKDLPSEAWAEMMDLWHCHKPEEPEHTHDDAPAKKGYAAGNKLVAQTGVGLVDVMSFLLSDGDCTVEVSNPFSSFVSQSFTHPPFPSGSQEGVFYDHCVISMRNRFDTKTQDQQRLAVRRADPQLGLMGHSSNSRRNAPSYLLSMI